MMRTGTPLGCVLVLHAAAAAAEVNAELPCCTQEAPEPSRIGRCQAIKTTGSCKGGPRSHTSRLCPVACGRCVVCAAHPLYADYGKLCGGACVRGPSGAASASAATSSALAARAGAAAPVASASSVISSAAKSDAAQPKHRHPSHASGEAALQSSDKPTGRTADTTGTTVDPHPPSPASGSTNAGDSWRQMAKWVLGSMREENDELREQIADLKVRRTTHTDLGPFGPLHSKHLLSVDCSLL